MGSGMVPQNTGVMRQERGELFSLNKKHANDGEGGKRAVNTMMPAIITKEGKPSVRYG